MSEKAICDTSILILFDKINALSLLQKLYGEVIITPAIKNEYGKTIPGWVLEHEVTNSKKLIELEQQVDIGEASAVALSLEINNSVLLIDDKKGRKLALKHHLKLSGTLGTLLKAKQKRLIPAIKPYINKLNTIDYRVSAKLEHEILKRAGEV